MNHFRLIRSDVDIIPFVEELRDFNGAWDTARSVTVDVQRETLDIPLRTFVTEAGKELRDCHQSTKTQWYGHFPKLTALLEEVVKELGGELSRAMIVSLRPHGRVYRHWDRGEYYAIRDRYHLVLSSKGGSRMHIEDEECMFKEGELWWYNNKGFHESYNDSDHERVHVIFDVLPSLKNSFWDKLQKRLLRNHTDNE